MLRRMTNKADFDDLSEVDCLMCGSQQSCDRMLYSDREEWSNSICNLLNINDPEVAGMFALSYYCRKCNDDLRKVNQFLRQIAELNEKLHTIKSKCLSKLDRCVEGSKKGQCSRFQTHVHRRAYILPYLKEPPPRYVPVSSGSQVVHVIPEEIVDALSDQMINISPDQIIHVSPHQLSAAACNNSNVEESSEMLNTSARHMLSESADQIATSESGTIFSNQKIVLSEHDGTLSVELVMTDSSSNRNGTIHQPQIPGPTQESWFPQDNFVESEIEIKTDADFPPSGVIVMSEDNNAVNCLAEDMEQEKSNQKKDDNNDICPTATVTSAKNRSIIEQAMELANNDLISNTGEQNRSCPEPPAIKKLQRPVPNLDSVENNFVESLHKIKLPEARAQEIVSQNQKIDMRILEEYSTTMNSQTVSATELNDVPEDLNDGVEDKGVYDEDPYQSDDDDMDLNRDPFSLSDEDEYGSSVSTIVSDAEDESKENVMAYTSQGQEPDVPAATLQTDWDITRYEELKTKYNLKEFSVHLQRPWVIKIVDIASLLKQCSPAPTTLTSEISSRSTATTSNSLVNTMHTPEQPNLTATGSSKQVLNGKNSTAAPNATADTHFQCTVAGCRMRFQFEVQRNAHIKRLHEGVKRPYECSVCNITFVTYKQYSFHETAHEAKPPFNCITCGNGFEERQGLVDHIDIYGHHPESLLCLPCPEPNCSKKFIDEIRRDAHVKKNHEGIKNPYECPTCFRKFSCYRYLKDHENHHANVHPYTCEVCGRKFYSQLRLREHVKFHGPKNLQCEHCGKEFVSKGRYATHLRTHTKERPFVCEVCGKGFTQRKYLRYHLPAHPELNLEQAVCKICNKIFSHHQTLRIHELQHSGEFKYRCTICDFGAPSQYALNNHLAKHKEDREYSCELCSKKFKTEKYLKLHVKQQHDEAKVPFDCSSCGKQLKSRIGLMRHEALHGDSFPFVCNFCGKCYPLKYYLDSHMMKCSKKKVDDKEIVTSGTTTQKSSSPIEVSPPRKRKRIISQTQLDNSKSDNFVGLSDGGDRVEDNQPNDMLLA